jgi:hypothetical protein
MAGCGCPYASKKRVARKRVTSTIRNPIKSKRFILTSGKYLSKQQPYRCRYSSDFELQEENEEVQKSIPKKLDKIPQPPLKVYLSINIIKSEIKSGKNTAKTKFTCQELTGDILDIINNIYKPANINFVIKSCKAVPAEPQATNVYTQDVRDVERLFNNKKLFIRDAVNIFMVPIVSDETNGYQFGTRESFIVQGEYNPVLWRPNTKIELAQLLAHEIGHDLGLKKHEGEQNNLMYYIGPGPTNLEADQIKKLRSNIANKFLARSKQLERSTDVFSMMERPIKYKVDKR